MLAVASAFILALAPPAPVISSGPAEGAQTTRSTVTFEFTAPSDSKVLGFECKVGKAGVFQDCSKGRFAVSGLTVGTHTFSVRSYDTVEAVSETVERTWTVTGIDDDQDGAVVPADCNDGNPAIRPVAPEVPGNGIDENCDGLDTAPPVTPVTPAAPAATPTPAPGPTAERAKLEFSLSYFMRARKRDTRFSTLSLKGVPAGSTIDVTCTGGCPRKRLTLENRSGTVALTAFRNRALRAGAKLTIQVTKPGTIGMSKVVTIRSGKRPTITTKALR